MPDPEITIRTEPRNPNAVAKRKRRSFAPWLIAASSACMALLAIAVFMLGRGTPPQAAPRVAAPSGETPPVAAGATESNQTPEPAKGNESGAQEQLVDDPRGELLWSSPTAGPPLSLAYVPAGTQCIIHLRPAMIVAHPEGERVLAALGPWGKRIAERMQSLLGAPLAEIESLLASVVVNDNGKLDLCLRVEFVKPLTDEDFAAGFPLSQKKQHREHTYWIVDDWAYFISRTEALSDDADKGQLIICPVNQVAELIDAAGESPPLVRDMEQLCKQADADRAFTAIVAPKFFQASGNELLAGSAAQLHDAMEWLVGTEATAISLSAHWDANFFTELRATPTLNVPPRRLAAKLRERIAAAPDAVEEIVLDTSWHPYGRKVLARFPGMLRALSRYSRAGEADRQAIVRAYLPPVAGHNLLLAAELLLTQPHTGELGEIASATGKPAEPATLEDRLAATTSLTFSRESLDRALEMLAEDAGVEIVIQGADLQLEGITRNQSLTLDLRDRAVGDILLEILLRANPDRTANDPGDPRQKLVYVLEPGQSSGVGRIIVTTRSAAGRRGDRLPALFLPKER